MEAIEGQYPISLGQPLVPSEQEFLDESSIGKKIYVIAYNNDHHIKFSGTLESIDPTNRLITLHSCQSLNPDGTVLRELPPQTSWSDPSRVFGYQFPTDLFGYGYTFRASRTSIPTLYELAYRYISKGTPGFSENPVIYGPTMVSRAADIGGTKRKRKRKKSKKSKK